MSDTTAQPAGPGAVHRAVRVLTLAATSAGVLLLAAAAFVLSYPGIHDLARTGGVAASAARLYPVIFDAMLMVTVLAVLWLRGAALLKRCGAWLVLLAMTAAAAGADVLHALNAHVPHRAAAATAAALPWALTLIGFLLLLAMLRQARTRRAAGRALRRAGAAAPDETGAAAASQDAAELAGSAECEASDSPAGNGAPSSAVFPAVAAATGLTSRNGHLAAGTAEAEPAEAEPAEAEPDGDHAAGQDDPTTDEANPVTAPAARWFPLARDEDDQQHQAAPAGPGPVPALHAAPTLADAEPAGLVEPAGLAESADLTQAEPADLAESGDPVGLAEAADLTRAEAADPAEAANRAGADSSGADADGADQRQEIAAAPQFDRVHSSPTPPGA
ncbi:MAG: DUF2637 domain-containing protein [Streptosporangiaceae bacterium]